MGNLDREGSRHSLWTRAKISQSVTRLLRARGQITREVGERRDLEGRANPRAARPPLEEARNPNETGPSRKEEGSDRLKAAVGPAASSGTAASCAPPTVSWPALSDEFHGPSTAEGNQQITERFYGFPLIAPVAMKLHAQEFQDLSFSSSSTLFFPQSAPSGAGFPASP
ncbi:hypothetical protein KM043_009349 [Ampulex compressa]|nr:hypothetical protein KM043_009349 [Ampulex compressa]